jgi:hypothetical protein
MLQAFLFAKRSKEKRREKKLLNDLAKFAQVFQIFSSAIRWIL